MWKCPPPPNYTKAIPNLAPLHKYITSPAITAEHVIFLAFGYHCIVIRCWVNWIHLVFLSTQIIPTTKTKKNGQYHCKVMECWVNSVFITGQSSVGPQPT